MNKTQLVDRLLEEGVPLSRWGNDVNGKIDRLAKEIEIYGAQINRDPMGRLTCACPIIEIDFLHNGKMLVRMGKIVDKGIRPMWDMFGGSMVVPLQKGRSPLDTAFDATQDLFALGPDHSFDNFTAYPIEIVGPMFSDEEYPGLRVIHVLYTFDWHVPLQHYKSAGYCDGDHISYWWLNLADVKTLDMAAVMRAISEAQL